MSHSSYTIKSVKIHIGVADTASWYCAIALITLVLFAMVKDDYSYVDEPVLVQGNPFLNRLCDELYVVGDSETLQTIINKCGDPYIVENNPHIHDPDDVFPGIVMKITPTRTRELMN